MEVALENTAHPVDRKRVHLHEPTEIALKYLEVSRAARAGSWSWLGDVEEKGDAVILTFTNYAAAQNIYERFRRLDEMTRGQALNSSAQFHEGTPGKSGWGWR